MIKVLIADNHPIVRMGVRKVLEAAEGFELIDEVATTEELFEKLKDTTPDVVMLEMDIPEINGIAALRKIKKDYADVKVLMYSGQSEDVYALSAIRAGAFGYLSKSSGIEYITAAVTKLLASGKRNKEVALGLNLNEKTVSTYKARLMKKLNVDNMVDLLQQAKALELY